MSGYNFTDRVRKTLQMARDEAARLHHDYVGTEHILLGLIAEGGGVGVQAMKGMGADPAALKYTIELTVKAGKASNYTPGPELPYTSRAKKCLELAMMEARELNHSYVGTEHLVLGLVREEKGIAAQVLTAAGIDLDGLRRQVAGLLGTDLPLRDAERVARFTFPNPAPPTPSRPNDSLATGSGLAIMRTLKSRLTVMLALVALNAAGMIYAVGKDWFDPDASPRFAMMHVVLLIMWLGIGAYTYRTSRSINRLVTGRSSD